MAEVECLRLTGDLTRQVEACLDSRANSQAVNVVQEFSLNRSRCPDRAVYVIAADDIGICKVGSAANPFQRLIELQVGNWHQLKIHGLVWFDRRATQVEKLVHSAAREMNIYIRGEWIETNPSEACELILKAARYDGQNAYDSASWVKNWSSRAAALASANKTEQRIAA